MYARKSPWILISLLALMAITLMSAPLAFAWDHDNHGGHRHGPTVQVHDQDNDEDENRDDDDDARNAADVRLDRLIDAINADVTMLSKLSVNTDGDEDSDDSRFHDVRTISLATLEKNLSATDAASVTTAVNANSAALQTFLNGGSAQAMAIDNALNAAGVSPSTALAIFPTRGHRLFVITS